MDEANATIGQRLRRELAITQEELAERAGVSRDLIAKLEQGARQSARLSSLTRIANALDVSLSELTGSRPQLDGQRKGASVMALAQHAAVTGGAARHQPGRR